MTSAPISVTTTLRRRRGLTEEAARAAVDQACRRLRLPTMRVVVAELLMAECDDRDRRSSLRRVKAAGFPRDK